MFHAGWQNYWLFSALFETDFELAIVSPVKHTAFLDNIQLQHAAHKLPIKAAYLIMGAGD